MLLPVFSTWVIIALVLGYAIWCALIIVPLWRVFDRARLAPALSLLFAVPVAGPLVVLLLLAFMRWPSLQR